MNHSQNLIKQISLIGLSLGLISCGGGGGSDSPPVTTPPVVTPPVVTPPEVEEVPQVVGNGWKLMWNDEFAGDTVNTDNWSIINNDCSGGGNNEKQCYTNNAENVFVADGYLHLVAKTAAQGASRAYTSGKLDSRNKVDFKYGRIEVRIKLPAGQGAFPAAWMMPTDEVYGSWPHSGEIDIVESVNLKEAATDGSVESYVHGNLHYGDTWPKQSNSGATYPLAGNVNPADDFHTYTLEWQAGEIRWYVDNVLRHTQRKSQTQLDDEGNLADTLAYKGWYSYYRDPISNEFGPFWDNSPFDQEFYMILNFAVGGDWAENTNNTGIDASAFANGNNMLVDYVRLYQCDVDSETGIGCGTTHEGYDSIANKDAKGALVLGTETLVLGKAPNPPTNELDPNSPAPPLVIFAEETHTGWLAWDCCGNTTPSIKVDDSAYGEVTEFTINGSTVVGFSTRAGHGVVDGTPFNASNMKTTGIVEFDLKMTESLSDADWFFKIESNGGTDAGGEAASVALADSEEAHASPLLDTWQHYTFKMADLISLGLDPTSIDVLMIFPEWGQGNGTIFSIDNVVISKSTESYATELSLFKNQLNAQWPAWDCCAGSTPKVVNDDEEHSNVVEFSIGTTATVKGFMGRDQGSIFDASGIADTGVVEFDLKLITSPGDVNWAFKIESNGGADGGGEFVEVLLKNSNEGHVTPELGVWQHYSFTLASLATVGLNLSGIDVVMMFPAWGAGNGAVYRVDNVRIGNP